MAQKGNDNCMVFSWPNVMHVVYIALGNQDTHVLGKKDTAILQRSNTTAPENKSSLPYKTCT
jgi:hypothetical protein